MCSKQIVCVGYKGATSERKRISGFLIGRDLRPAQGQNYGAMHTDLICLNLLRYCE